MLSSGLLRPRYGLLQTLENAVFDLRKAPGHDDVAVGCARRPQWTEVTLVELSDQLVAANRFFVG